MTQQLVLDASAGVEILERTFAGRRLAKDLSNPDTAVWTVEHFGLEVAKVLRRDVLRGDVADNDASRRLSRLVTRWDINLVRVTSLLLEAWKLRHSITVHDALYVVLARQLGATLVTGDRKLAKAPGLDVAVRSV